MALERVLLKTGLFVEKKGAKPAQPGLAASSSVSAATPSVVTSSNFVASTATAAAPVPDPKYVKGLGDFMLTVSSERYLAFLRQIEKLGKVLTDERQLYKAALIAVDGLTVDEILHEITDCEGVLAEQRSQFETGIQSRIMNAINTKETAIAKIDAEIAGLMARMEQLKVQRETVAREVSDANQRAEVERGGFAAALAQHTKALRDLRERVDLYLKEVRTA